MYVRPARKNEESWLMNKLEYLGLDEPGFRSRQFRIVIDEEEKVAFARLRPIADSTDEELSENERLMAEERGERDPDEGDELVDESEITLYELTSVAVLTDANSESARSKLFEGIRDTCDHKNVSTLYTFTDNPRQFTPHGFEVMEVEDLPEDVRKQFDSKQENFGEQLTPLSVAPEEFKETDDVSEADVESEAEAQGFSDNSYTTKYSV